MSCGKEGDGDAVGVEFFAPVASNDVRTEQPGTQDTLRLGGADICARSPSRVVAVGVRDDGAVNRHPRVDVEITCFAVEAAFGGAEKVVHDQKFSQRIAEPRARLENQCYNN